MDFNYAQWGANSVAKFCAVPWNSDYRDVVKFPNDAGMTAYVNGLPGPEIRGLTYQKFGRPLRVDRRFAEMMKYNYVRVLNPAQPGRSDVPSVYYYFITAVTYVAPETTEITIQLDVWSSFINSTRFGNCYIQQGHIGIANERQFEDYGREFLTQPEGRDIGGEYNIALQYSETIASARNANPGSAQAYSVLVTTTTSFIDENDAETGKPVLVTATGSMMENLPNGCEIYVFNSGEQFRLWLAANKEKTWKTQGIISVMAIPYADRYGMTSELPSGATGVDPEMVLPGTLKTIKTVLAPNWRDTALTAIPARYRGLKKLLTYPYTVLELTTYAGNPIVIKPESWNDKDGTVVEVPHFAPPAPRLAFYPYRYNAKGVAEKTDASGVVNDGGEFLDLSTGITDFPMFSVVNNGYQSYLASSGNSIAFQHSSADWAQTRAQAGAQLGYNQASSGMDLNRQMTGIGIDAGNQRTNLANDQAGFNAIKGAVGNVAGVIGGGPMGIAAGAAGLAMTGANYAMETHMNNAGNAVSVGAATAGMNAQLGNAGMVRDSNLAYANMASNGDYEQAIAGINAKVQDAKMIQPNTSGQSGGNAFMLSQYKWGYDLKVKMLQGSAMRSNGEHWLRYGYLVNQFGKLPKSLMTHSKFTYWKLAETYIVSAACPETLKQSLRGILEKGVTVWSDPNDIGQIDIADNQVLPGVRL